MIKAKLKYVAIGIISACVLSFVLYGNGCGSLEPVGGLNDSQYSGANSCGVEGVDEIEVTPGESTVSLAYGRQVLDNMVACTGIGYASASTEAEWQKRSNSLSEYGFATEVSAPMMMGIAAVAGEVCNDLLNYESSVDPSNRLIFREMDLTSDILLSDDFIKPIHLLALSCWQRNETDEERQMLLDSIKDIGGNANISALAVCTSMLSSLSGIQM